MRSGIIIGATRPQNRQSVPADRLVAWRSNRLVLFDLLPIAPATCTRNRATVRGWPFPPSAELELGGNTPPREAMSETRRSRGARASLGRP